MNLRTQAKELVGMEFYKVREELFDVDWLQRKTGLKYKKEELLIN